MALVGTALGRGVALALLGDDMDQDRPVGPRLDRAQHRQKAVHVMPVDRAQVGKAQRFEQRAADRHALDHVLGALGAFAEGFGQEADRALGRRFEILKRLFGIETVEVGGHGPDGRRNRHFIVVEDDEHALFEVTRVVHRLKGHAGAHRPVTDDGDRIPKTFRHDPAEITCHRKAQGR